MPLFIAAGVGYILGIEVVKGITARTSGTGVPVPILGMTYYLSVGAGLLVSLAIVLSTLPLLNNITRSDNARFE